MSEIVKVISRISKKGNEYYQSAINKSDGTTDWVPVFIKKELEGKFDYISKEKKVDKAGVVYTVFELKKENVWIVPKKDEKENFIKDTVEKIMIMK